MSSAVNAVFNGHECHILLQAFFSVSSLSIFSIDVFLATFLNVLFMVVVVDFFFLFGDHPPRLFDLNWQPVYVYVIAIMANRIACMSITPFTFSKYSHRLLVVSFIFVFVRL